MKLFKRTSIFLIIFIALVWTAVITLIEYPEDHIRVTDVEIKQTRQLLEKNNIEVPDKLIKKSVHSIKTASVENRFENAEAAAEKIVGSGAAKSSDGTYISGSMSMSEKDGELFVSGTLDGYTDKSSALTRARKLVSSFALAYDEMEAHVYEKDDTVSISLIPQIDGKNVFDCPINITISPNGAYKLEAKPVTFSKNGRELVKSPCSALAELAGAETANGLTVTDMNIGYKVKDGAAYPVWEIVTADGGRYYV